MSLIRNFIVSCRIGQQFRQLSSTVGVSNDKLPSRLPPGYRPINAYALYCQEFLKERKEDSVLLAMSAAAKQWKTMDEKTKAGYEKKSKEIAEERKAAFENLPPKEKEDLQQMQLKFLDRRVRMKRRATLRERAEESGRPKAPMSAYAIYIKEFYEQQDEMPSDLPKSQKLMSEAAEKWKSLPAEDKKKYEKQAEPARKEYEKAMELWKAKQEKVHAKEMEARQSQREREKLLREKEKLAREKEKLAVRNFRTSVKAIAEKKVPKAPKVVQPASKESPATKVKKTTAKDAEATTKKSKEPKPKKI